MKERNWIKRALVGLILIALAAFLSYYLKDYIDRKNPDYAIPKLRVTADGQEVSVYISSYYWEFAFGDTTGRDEAVLDGGAVTAIDDGLVPVTQLHGGEVLRYEFSETVNSKLIDRSESYSTIIFNQADNERYVTSEPGAYFYKVMANYDRGWVQYYFRIDVV